MVWLVYFDWKCGLLSGGWHSAPVIKERYSIVNKVLLYTVFFDKECASYSWTVQSAEHQSLKSQWSLVSVKYSFNFTTCFDYCVTITKVRGLTIWTNCKIVSYYLIQCNVIYCGSVIQLNLNCSSILSVSVRICVGTGCSVFSPEEGVLQ